MSEEMGKENSRPYNVLLVEDQAMPRQLFEIFIESLPQYKLLYSIDSALSADIYCEKNNIDLVLMDIITAGGENGLDAAERIKRKHPEVKVIIVTSMPECSYLQRARDIGVDSFWYKETSKEPIHEIMDRTMAGEHVFPSTTPCLRLGNTLSSDFTERELEVLREMTTGETNAQIASKLHVSVDTVKYHIKQMQQKTGFQSRTELAVKARVSGLVICDE